MIQFLCQRFRARADGSPDEAGIAMIIVITVVMLMTLIPLAIVNGAVAQLRSRATTRTTSRRWPRRRPASTTI